MSQRQERYKESRAVSGTRKAKEKSKIAISRKKKIIAIEKSNSSEDKPRRTEFLCNGSRHRTHCKKKGESINASTKKGYLSVIFSQERGKKEIKDCASCPQATCRGRSALRKDSVFMDW